MRFPRQEYWSGLSFPSPGDLPNPGTEPVSSALACGFFTPEPPGKPTTARGHHYRVCVCGHCQLSTYDIKREAKKTKVTDKNFSLALGV